MLYRLYRSLYTFDFFLMWPMQVLSVLTGSGDDPNMGGGSDVAAAVGHGVVIVSR